MTAKKIVITLGILAVLSGPLAFAQEKSKDQTLYEKAKSAVYEKDYQSAVYRSKSSSTLTRKAPIMPNRYTG